MTALARLCPETVLDFRPDGTLTDLACPRVEEVDFAEMASRLSGIGRYNGFKRQHPFSVAQHSVLGAESLFRLTGDAFLAGLFLLHDGHEYLIGDWTNPSQELQRYRIAVRSPRAAPHGPGSTKDIKAGWDEVIYRAAGLPAPSDWSNAERAAVKDMDVAMLAAETNLFFPKTAPALYPLPAERAHLPKAKALEPWPHMKAEMDFIDAFHRFIGKDAFYHAAALAAAHRAMED